LADREENKLKKLSEKELFIDDQIINKTKNCSYRLISFKSNSDTNDIFVQTDADLYGGDTVANLSYNIKEDSCNIKHYE
jgi:hypothetical protein